MAASTETSLMCYHKKRGRQGPHTLEWWVDTLYAYDMGVITAAHAAYGTTNKGQGVWSIPLTNADEVHILWIPPHHWNYKEPVKLRYLIFPNNASSGITLTTTYDKVAWGEGATAATLADGATSLTSTHSAITDAETTADYPLVTEWAQVNKGSETDFDAFFFKMVASGQTGADRARLIAAQFAFKSLVF